MQHPSSILRAVVPTLALLAVAACGGDDDNGTGPNACTGARVTQAIGATTNGTLATGDCQIASAFIDRYTFTVPAGGAAVRIRSASDDIDPLLKLYDTQSRLIAENDDSADADGETTNAFMTVLLPAGTYNLDATSFIPNETGAYSLSVTSVAQSVSGCSGGDFGQRVHIAIGMTTEQQVQTGDCAVTPPGAGGTFYSDRFLLHLPAGRTATIRMSSTALDPYLFIINVTGSAPYPSVEDDDSGGGTTARITFAASNAARDLVIDAGTADVGQTGAYTLTVEP